MKFIIYLNKGVFSSLVSVILVAVLALTNGFYTSNCFYFGPQLVNNELKGKAASVTCLFLGAGIFAGSLFANFISQKLV